MRFLDFFITTCLLFLTFFSSATTSFINDTDSSNTAPSTIVIHLNATKQTSTTSETTSKEAMNTTFISNITTQAANPTTSSLTVQTTSTTIQPLSTNIPNHTSQTSTPMTTATSNTTQTPTTNISNHTSRTLTATTTTSNTTAQPPSTNLSTHTAQRLTSTTTTTSNPTELPTTNISSHTTQTSTAMTTANKTTKQPSNTYTQTTETSTSITSKPSSSTEAATVTIPNHTSQTLTATTTTTSNTTEAPTTSISNHTSQTSFPTITTTINPTELPTTNISSQTTQTSTHTTFTTNSNTTLLSTASSSTQTSLSTTIEEILTSANIPKQTTRQSSNTTTVTAAVESSSQEHIINNSKNTTPTENDTSQPTSTQINTTNSLSSTSSSSTTTPTSSSRTSTSRTSAQQTTVNPVTTTFRLPDVTLVPTEMLSLGINNTLSLQFTMLITMNISGLESFNETIFSYMLVGYVFVGYEFIPTLHVSYPLGKNTRHRREETSESNSNEANYTTTIIADIPVSKLREQRKTIKEFASDISNNIRHNISNFTSPAWHAVNNSDEIEKKLKSQTEGMSECHASGKLCPLGYDCCPCNEDHYTGICVHRCDLEKKECKNNGHCIFDSMISKTACSCQSTWITLYYGSNCEEQTGKLETVIGFTLGSAVLVIVLVFTAVLCCIRNRDGVKEFRRHDDKSALESDFLSDSGGVQIMDLNYRKSTKFIPSSLDVDPVLKTLDPGPADINVSEILETSGCSTISSSNSNKTFKEDENKHQESTMSRDSGVRKPEDNNYVPTNFQSTCPPASTPEISRVSMKPKQENRTNNRQTSFLFGP